MATRPKPSAASMLQDLDKVESDVLAVHLSIPGGFQAIRRLVGNPKSVEACRSHQECAVIRVNAVNMRGRS
jgi:hypothetical protein